MATYTSYYNLTKPEGTERVNIGIINQNMDAIDTQMHKNAQSIIANHGGMAIPSNNNTHAAVSAGQYVYVYNHSSLSEGMYVATSAISTNGALSLSNLSAVSNGGLNHVYNTLNSKLTYMVQTVANTNISAGTTYSIKINVPSGYIPIALTNIDLTFNVSALLGTPRKLPNGDWFMGIWSSGANTVYGDVGVLFSKA